MHLQFMTKIVIQKRKMHIKNLSSEKNSNLSKCEVNVSKYCVYYKLYLFQDLTVTDDTVLEEHSEDPTLVQMRLIGDGGKCFRLKEKCSEMNKRAEWASASAAKRK